MFNHREIPVHTAHWQILKITTHIVDIPDVARAVGPGPGAHFSVVLF
jgi:hypothetical protein